MSALPEVILVDDDDDTLPLLTELISNEGCEITTATTAEAALRHFATRHPHVLTGDVHLPGMNGWALLKKIRAVQPDVPIILLTAAGPRLLEARATGTAVSPYLLIQSCQVRLSHRTRWQLNRSALGRTEQLQFDQALCLKPIVHLGQCATAFI
ncbi:hypothetical protein W02_16830 [Nitrospira sp. KM1]|uniref:response regulator n=1 Tax=Nitrospira sp. KM1 TaxID=1936990 RepID=UPI0013A7661C|nr:hypothetical protein W02_16830 [Nitrospira sp. KM1]